MKIKKCDEHVVLSILEEYIDNGNTEIMKKYFHHADVSTFDHVMNVVYASYKMSKALKLKVDIKSLVIGAFLHDYYLYDCKQEESRGKYHRYRHPKAALKNAEKHYELNDKVKNIIASHMWPLTITKVPRSKEAFLICFADKYCAIGEFVF